ncbi:M14 family zinc carboxypeptidase, partial [Solicola sp. PLA-1-18]|uniref:M14 family zinc carboxypeptidase n=1 Tax=Solicola sp. PLA-1-18 TaxID=3380532 RepID=UPI003B7B24F0
MRLRTLPALVVTAALLASSALTLTAAEAAPKGPRKLTIGHSVKDRPIKAWRLGDPSAKTKVLVFSAMHGDEVAPRTILRNLRDGSDIANVDLWVVPVVNPDAVARDSRYNARGVDVNRNFPVAWKKRKHAGSRPASQPETRALMKLTNRVDPDYVINFHQPLYGIDTTDSRSPAFADSLRRNLKLPAKAFRCGSGCHGTFTQWFDETHDGTTITVELGRKPTRAYLTRT